jgi:hypothetical protein
MDSLEDEDSRTIELVPRQGNAIRGNVRPQTILEFLHELRVDMQADLLRMEPNQKRASVGDYLKLVSVIEERERAEQPAEKEIVVRWVEPSEEEDILS